MDKMQLQSMKCVNQTDLEIMLLDYKLVKSSIVAFFCLLFISVVTKITIYICYIVITVTNRV